MLLIKHHTLKRTVLFRSSDRIWVAIQYTKSQEKHFDRIFPVIYRCFDVYIIHISQLGIHFIYLICILENVAIHWTFLTRRIQIFCLCWSKESPLWLNISPVCHKFVQSFVRSNNTSVAFIGALARYSSSCALGRNYTRCQNSACLEIPDTGLLARSHCIRELLDVRGGVLDIPGLDIDEFLATINEICCNWFSLCIICNLF